MTELEKKMLENIITNDYNDISDGDTYPIWSNAWDCGINGNFCSNKQASGIVSSLVKKKLVWSDGGLYGAESRMSLTDNGVKLCKSLWPDKLK